LPDRTKFAPTISATLRTAGLALMIPIRDFTTLFLPEPKKDPPRYRRFYFRGQELSIPCDEDEQMYAQFACRSGYLLITSDQNFFDCPEYTIVIITYVDKTLTHVERMSFLTAWPTGIITHSDVTGLADLSDRELEYIGITGNDEVTIVFRKKHGIFNIRIFDPPRRFLWSAFTMAEDIPRIWQRRHLQVHRTFFPGPANH